MRTRRIHRSAFTHRPLRTRLATAAVVGAAAVGVLTGCAGLAYTEAICSGGEYPALAVGSTGSACFPDEEQPSSGYARYPTGKVPKQVDDKWDVYWRTHTVDKDGSIVTAPDAD